MSSLCAVCLINPTSPALTGRVMNWISRIGSVKLAHHVLGPDPVICFIECEGVDEFRHAIDSMRECPYVKSIDSRMLVTDPYPLWNEGAEVVLEEYMAWVFLTTANGDQRGTMLNVRNMPRVVGTRTFDSGPDDGVALVQFRRLNEFTKLAQALQGVGVTRFNMSVVAPKY